VVVVDVAVLAVVVVETAVPVTVKTPYMSRSMSSCVDEYSYRPGSVKFTVTVAVSPCLSRGVSLLSIEKSCSKSPSLTTLKTTVPTGALSLESVKPHS